MYQNESSELPTETNSSPLTESNFVRNPQQTNYDYIPVV